jgi:LysM repeat protein
MKKPFLVRSHYWIGIGVLLTVLLAGPVGPGFAHGSDDASFLYQETPASSVLETPVPTTESTEVPTTAPTSTVVPTGVPTTVPTSTAVPTGVPTSTPAPTAIPSTILGYHTVQAGQTLFCIGRAYGVDPYAIAVKNGIVNPNSVRPGQVLAIPNAPRLLPPGPVCPRQFGGATPAPSSCRWNHTVIWGENLYRISLRYGVSMYTIAAANHIANLNYIRAGQVLCIP